MYHNKHPDRKVAIRYSLEGSYHRIEIHDNGQGIEETYREQIFTAFQRLHHREDYQGNGIGLAICKKIVDQQRGKIFVTDSDFGGSCFVINLPLKKQPPPST